MPVSTVLPFKSDDRMLMAVVAILMLSSLIFGAAVWRTIAGNAVRSVRKLRLPFGS